MCIRDKFLIFALILGFSTALFVVPICARHDPVSAAALLDKDIALQETIFPIITSTPGRDGSVSHIVEEGQTAWSIAMQYGIDLYLLYQLNDIGENDVLFTGDELVIIPGPTATVSPTPAPTSSPQPATSTVENIAIDPASTPVVSAVPASENNDLTVLVIAGFCVSGILITLCVNYCVRNKRI